MYCPQFFCCLRDDADSPVWKRRRDVFCDTESENAELTFSDLVWYEDFSAVKASQKLVKDRLFPTGEARFWRHSARVWPYRSFGEKQNSADFHRQMTSVNDAGFLGVKDIRHQQYEHHLRGDTRSTLFPQNQSDNHRLCNLDFTNGEILSPGVRLENETSVPSKLSDVADQRRHFAVMKLQDERSLSSREGSADRNELEREQRLRIEAELKLQSVQAESEQCRAKLRNFQQEFKRMEESVIGMLQARGSGHLQQTRGLGSCGPQNNKFHNQSSSLWDSVATSSAKSSSVSKFSSTSQAGQNLMPVIGQGSNSSNVLQSETPVPTGPANLFTVPTGLSGVSGPSHSNITHTCTGNQSTNAVTVSTGVSSNTGRVSIMQERVRKLEEENSELVLENEEQRQEYESCLEDMINEIVQALMAQKTLRQENRKLEKSVQEISEENSRLNRELNKLRLASVQSAASTHPGVLDISGSVPTPAANNQSHLPNESYPLGYQSQPQQREQIISTHQPHHSQHLHHHHQQQAATYERHHQQRHDQYMQAQLQHDHQHHGVSDQQLHFSPSLPHRAAAPPLAMITSQSLANDDIPQLNTYSHNSSQDRMNIQQDHVTSSDHMSASASMNSFASSPDDASQHTCATGTSSSRQAHNSLSLSSRDSTTRDSTLTSRDFHQDNDQVAGHQMPSSSTSADRLLADHSSCSAATAADQHPISLVQRSTQIPSDIAIVHRNSSSYVTPTTRTSQQGQLSAFRKPAAISTGSKSGMVKSPVQQKRTTSSNSLKNLFHRKQKRASSTGKSVPSLTGSSSISSVPPATVVYSNAFLHLGNAKNFISNIPQGAALGGTSRVCKSSSLPRNLKTRIETEFPAAISSSPRVHRVSSDNLAARQVLAFANQPEKNDRGSVSVASSTRLSSKSEANKFSATDQKQNLVVNQKLNSSVPNIRVNSIQLDPKSPKSLRKFFLKTAAPSGGGAEQKEGDSVFAEVDSRHRRKEGNSQQPKQKKTLGKLRKRFGSGSSSSKVAPESSESRDNYNQAIPSNHAANLAANTPAFRRDKRRSYSESASSLASKSGISCTDTIQHQEATGPIYRTALRDAVLISSPADPNDAIATGLRAEAAAGTKLNVFSPFPRKDPLRAMFTGAGGVSVLDRNRLTGNLKPWSKVGTRRVRNDAIGERLALANYGTTSCVLPAGFGYSLSAGKVSQGHDEVRNGRFRYFDSRLFDYSSDGETSSLASSVLSDTHANKMPNARVTNGIFSVSSSISLNDVLEEGAQTGDDDCFSVLTNFNDANTSEIIRAPFDEEFRNMSGHFTADKRGQNNSPDAKLNAGIVPLEKLANCQQHSSPHMDLDSVDLGKELDKMLIAVSKSSAGTSVTDSPVGVPVSRRTAPPGHLLTTAVAQKLADEHLLPSSVLAIISRREERSSQTSKRNSSSSALRFQRLKRGEEIFNGAFSSTSSSSTTDSDAERSITTPANKSSVKHKTRPHKTRMLLESGASNKQQTSTTGFQGSRDKLSARSSDPKLNLGAIGKNVKGHYKFKRKGASSSDRAQCKSLASTTQTRSVVSHNESVCADTVNSTELINQIEEDELSITPTPSKKGIECVTANRNMRSSSSLDQQHQSVESIANDPLVLRTKEVAKSTGECSTQKTAKVPLSAAIGRDDGYSSMSISSEQQQTDHPKLFASKIMSNPSKVGTGFPVVENQKLSPIYSRDAAKTLVDKQMEKPIQTDPIRVGDGVYVTDGDNHNSTPLTSQAKAHRSEKVVQVDPPEEQCDCPCHVCAVLNAELPGTVPADYFSPVAVISPTQDLTTSHPSNLPRKTDDVPHCTEAQTNSPQMTLSPGAGPGTPPPHQRCIHTGHDQLNDMLLETYGHVMCGHVRRQGDNHDQSEAVRVSETASLTTPDKESENKPGFDFHRITEEIEQLSATVFTLRESLTSLNSFSKENCCSATNSAGEEEIEEDSPEGSPNKVSET